MIIIKLIILNYKENDLKILSLNHFLYNNIDGNSRYFFTIYIL